VDLQFTVTNSDGFLRILNVTQEIVNKISPLVLHGKCSNTIILFFHSSNHQRVPSHDFDVQVFQLF
jgi:hypothetical protein